jgi:hypothetical protein
MSELMKMGEYFIAVRHITENKIFFNNIVAGHYVENNLLNLYEKKNKSNNKIINTSRTGLKSLYYTYENKENEGFYSIYSNKNREYSRSLNSQIIYHSASYMIKHYLHLTELLQVSKTGLEYLESAGLTFLDDKDTIEFLEKIKTNYELYNLVAFQYYLYKAFSGKDHEENYKKARKISKMVMNRLDDDYKLYMYQLMINYCIEQTNRRVIKYYSELFEIYNEKLKQNLFQDLKVGNFPINNFRDYIFVSLKLNKLDWAKWFIENYSQHLASDQRDDEVNLSYAKIMFEKSQFQQSLETVSKVKGENYLHYTDSSMLKMKLFYELSMFEDGFEEIDRFTHYLRNHNEIPKVFNKSISAFAKRYKLLLKAKTDPSEKNIERLMMEKEQFNLYDWFKDKITEFA